MRIVFIEGHVEDPDGGAFVEGGDAAGAVLTLVENVEELVRQRVADGFGIFLSEEAGTHGDVVARGPGAAAGFMLVDGRVGEELDIKAQLRMLDYCRAAFYDDFLVLFGKVEREPVADKLFFFRRRQRFNFFVPKSLQMVTAAMKLKDAYSLEGKL